MATHSSILAWKIPWTQEPGGLQSMGLQRVRHSRARTHVCSLCWLGIWVWLSNVLLTQGPSQACSQLKLKSSQGSTREKQSSPSLLCCWQDTGPCGSWLKSPHKMVVCFLSQPSEKDFTQKVKKRDREIAVKIFLSIQPNLGFFCGSDSKESAYRY